MDGMTSQSAPGGELTTNRLVALSLGHKQYYSGRKCPKGHEPPVLRQAINGSCARCNAAYAMKRHAAGVRPTLEQRKATLARWNSSDRAAYQKQKWKEKDPVRAWVVGVINGSRARSIKKGLPFDLTHGYIRSIIPTHCPALGVELKFLQRGGGRPDSATLDRIIPSRGYTQGNVAVVSLRANLIKNDGTLDDIEAVAKWMRTVCPRL